MPTQLVGGWELGLLALMALLFAVGVLINPAFFGSGDAIHAILRDTARYAVVAVGMTFVIVNKDLDLSVGSTNGLIGVAFSLLFAPSFADWGPLPATLFCLVLGTVIGLVNGVLVTILRVPSFIATLTMLLIGRGIILGLTGGKSIGYAVKARDYPGFFHLGETNAFGFNNQILIAFAVAVVGAVVLAKTRWGYETFATGGNEQAAIYAGIPTRWVRIRAYLLSSLCATVAGLMSITQDKGVTAQAGLSSELIVIAAVIIGGASILGGRGRVIGACLGAMLTVVIDKVLREGWPTTRVIQIDGQDVTVNAISQLPVGAVPALLGALLLLAVLVEPYVLRRRLIGRFWAWLRKMEPPLIIEAGGVAIEGVQTKGTVTSDKALHARGFGKFLARRDALAIILTVVLWLTGLWLRPDYWWEPAEQLRHPAQLYGAGAALDRPHLRHRRRRHRPLGRRGAGAGRRRHRLFHEGAGLRPHGRRVHGPHCRQCRRAAQRVDHRWLRPARLHRHPRHVLYRARRRRLDRGRAAADRVSGGLQSPGPQAGRHFQPFRS